MADHDNVYDDEELVSTNPNKRNWRGILIALLVIILVLALIVTSVALLTPPEEGPRIRGSRLRMTDILQGEFTPRLFNGSWMSHDHICFQESSGGISLLQISGSNYSIRNLMSSDTFGRFAPTSFSLSPDFKYLLLMQNTKKLFQYSRLAQYIIYNLQSREVTLVTPDPDAEAHPYLLKAEWTPRGHGLIMIRDYDIYYKTGPLSHITYRITTTGIPGILSNGFPNWLYEEEILHGTKAMWMSRDSNLLLHASFDDSGVKEMYNLRFGDGSRNKDLNVRALRYSKPGEKMTCVKLFINDLADPRNIQTKLVKPPMSIGNMDHYLTSAEWISPTEVCITWMNRSQNVSIVSVCKSPSWKCQEIQKVVFENRGWVDTPVDPPIFSINGTSYITIAPIGNGHRNFHRQIVWVNILMKQTLPLTHGEFEVVRILSWDDVKSIIFFIGIPSRKPSQRHLYRISSNIPEMGDPSSSAICMTCTSSWTSDHQIIDPGKLRSSHEGNDQMYDGERTKQENEAPELISLWENDRDKDVKRSCQYYNAIFSPTSTHFVLQCLGPDVPTVGVYEAISHDSRMIITLQDNAILRDKLADFALPQTKSFSVQTSGGYDAQVRLLLPPGLREDEITRYPLVLQIYGAPGSQLVTDVFEIDWSEYLASGRDIIVAQIDARGSGGRGYQLMHEIYKRLGAAEIADQLEVTEYLRDSLQFINKERIAAWGWSYGGFVTAHMLAQPEQDVIHCGISVAPIVSWEHHNSVYTERYMGSPNVSSNYHGYLKADLSKEAKHLGGKMFYLIHGTADDNVQFQQSMIMARHLIEENISFRQQVYPDTDHYFTGVRSHLYQSMIEFLDSCFTNQMLTNYHIHTNRELMLSSV